MNNKKHEKFHHILPKIDDKPPHFNVSTYLKPFDLQRDAIRVKEIDRENINLLKKINKIHRLGVSIACCKIRIILYILYACVYMLYF